VTRTLQRAIDGTESTIPISTARVSPQVLNSPEKTSVTRPFWPALTSESIAL
jgi:hypothetical protein